MNNKPRKRRDFYMPPKEGKVLDPITAALYPERVPGNEVAPKAEPAEEKVEEPFGVSTDQAEFRRQQALHAKKRVREAYFPPPADFTDCYMQEPAPKEVLVTGDLPQFSRFPGWRLERVELHSGDVIYRLSGQEAGQVGIFAFKKKALSFAPTNQAAFIPAEVSAEAQRCVVQNEAKEL